LVFGGTGTVGREVVRGLAQAGVETVFTWHRAREHAQALAAEHGARGVQLDLREPGAILALCGSLAEAPDIFVHAAGLGRAAPLAELTVTDLDDACAVGGRAAFVALQALAPRLAALGESHAVLVGALERSQSLPLPVAFAAAQGMLSAMTNALAKELGPGGTRVNLVALGPLEDGLSRALGEKRLDDYKKHSALHRLGTAREAARSILWLALENRYMSGKVLAVNGGI
jgi:3-oxoacyl-[acyl-carrier protein] reductase